MSQAVKATQPTENRGDRLAVLSRRIAALTVENEQLWEHFTWVLGILIEKDIVTEEDVRKQLEFQELGTLPGVASQDMEVIDDSPDAAEPMPADDLLDLGKAVDAERSDFDRRDGTHFGE